MRSYNEKLYEEHSYFRSDEDFLLCRETLPMPEFPDAQVFDDEYLTEMHQKVIEEHKNKNKEKKKPLNSRYVPRSKDVKPKQAKRVKPKEQKEQAYSTYQVVLQPCEDAHIEYSRQENADADYQKTSSLPTVEMFVSTNSVLDVVIVANQFGSVADKMIPEARYELRSKVDQILQPSIQSLVQTNVFIEAYPIVHALYLKPVYFAHVDSHAEGVIPLNTRGRLYLRMTNCTTSPILIRENQLLGHLLLNFYAEIATSDS